MPFSMSSDGLRNDRDIVLTALTQDRRVLKYASKDLQAEGYDELMASVPMTKAVS